MNEMRYITVLFFSLFLLSKSVYSQEFKYKKNIDKYIFKPDKGKLDYDRSYDQVLNHNDGNWAVRNGDYWGIVNSDGDEIVEPKYDEIKKNVRGYVIVMRDNKYGVLDDTGEEVEPIIYDKFDFYTEEKSIVKKNGVWGVLEDGVFDASSEDIILKHPDEKPKLKTCEEKPENCTLESMLEITFRNIKYPEQAKLDGIEGTVVAEIVINKTGQVEEVNILRSIGSGCDEELRRVIITYMNEWIPGKDGGEVIKSRYLYPIKFKLN